MTAQTISEAKQSTDFWTFLLQLPATMEAQLLYALVLSGIVGMFVNYAQRWARKEIDGGLLAYLFEAHLRGTLLSFFGAMSAGIAAITANVFVTDGGTFVGWGTVLWMGVTNGFAADAIANRGERKEWTEAERVAHAAAVTEKEKP